MKYKVEEDKVLVSLEKGDEIFNSLYNLIDEINIKFGWINGIGAVENITLGSYSANLKDYIKKEFKDEFELTSLIGNITTKNERPFIHIHVNVSDQECNAYGGHLFSGTITATCEIIILLSKEPLNRKKSSDIGLYLWDVNEE